MPDVEQHEEGMLNWADLATSDLPAAKAFYGELFGWRIADEGPAEAPYALAKLRDRAVAGLYPITAEERAAGIPPHWLSHFQVKDADAAAARAKDAGGRIVVPPFEPMGVARMAVVADREGAVFSLWQDRKHTGARVVNEPGALCWTELHVRDRQPAVEFYRSVFGWSAQEMTMAPGMVYTTFMVGQKPSCGLFPFTPDVPKETPPHWMIYLQVADCAGTLAKAQALGGKIMFPPMEAPGVGTFAAVQDGQGAIFGILMVKAP